jgi:hypothetical protein
MPARYITFAATVQAAITGTLVFITVIYGCHFILLFLIAMNNLVVTHTVHF